MQEADRRSARRSMRYRALPFAALLVAIAIRVYGNQTTGGIAWLEIAVPTLAIALLLPTVLVTLHHAEAAAVLLGEPLGTLLLTMAVTTKTIRRSRARPCSRS